MEIRERLAAGRDLRDGSSSRRTSTLNGVRRRRVRQCRRSRYLRREPPRRVVRVPTVPVRTVLDTALLCPPQQTENVQ